MKDKINQFTFFRNYWDVIKELPNKEEFVIAILEFVFEDKKPAFDGLNKGVWNLIERPLNISKNKSNNAKTKTNQKKIKLKSNTNQKEIKPKSTENQSHYSISFSISISNINNKDKINNLFKEYLEIRNKKKYIVNETIVNRLVNKLNTYGKTDEEKIRIIENAINGSWKDFYELNDKEKNSIEKNIPRWVDEQSTSEMATAEEIKELDDLMKEVLK